jgi:protein-tyrosine phosphatase
MATKILIVCHGNICRSPLAQALLNKKLNGKEIQIDSAGVSDYHAGKPADARSKANAALHHIDLSAHIARQFHSSDFDKYDRIYVMDSANLSDISLISRDESDLKKVRLFLDAAYPGSMDSVPDPWYGNEEEFEKVFHIIDKACDSLANKIKKNHLP